MAAGRKYDLNRLRKTYYDVRYRENNITTGTQVEAGTLTWADETDGKKYTFTGSYKSAPNVVITPASTDNGDVNVYITAITVSDVTIEPSGYWTGTVYIQIMESTE